MARSAVSVKMVLCPTKCVVASYSVQVCEDWSERLARVQLLGRLRIFGVHVHDEMGVRGEQSHLTFRIATIGAVSVGLDELPNSKAIRGFLGEMAMCLLISRFSSGLEDGAGFEKRLDPVRADIRGRRRST